MKKKIFQAVKISLDRLESKQFLCMVVVRSRGHLAMPIVIPVVQDPNPFIRYFFYSLENQNSPVSRSQLSIFASL